MRLEQLRYFVMICDKRSMNLASKALYITQQSLSSSMNQLEKEVGKKLLVRTNRGVYPTELGKRMYRFAQNTLQEWDDTINESDQNVYNDIYDTLNVLSTYSFFKTFMPKYSVHVLEHFPNLRGSGGQIFYDNILVSLYQHKIDFAFVTLATTLPVEAICPMQGMIFSPLFNCEPYAICNINSSLATQASVTVDRFLKENIIVNQESDMHLYRELFGSQHGDFLKKVQFFHLHEVVVEYIKQENKITLDLKLGPYGLTYQPFLTDPALTHVPIVHPDENFQIYGGVLINENDSKMPLVEKILSTL